VAGTVSIARIKIKKNGIFGRKKCAWLGEIKKY